MRRTQADRSIDRSGEESVVWVRSLNGEQLIYWLADEGVARQTLVSLAGFDGGFFVDSMARSHIETFEDANLLRSWDKLHN